MLPRRRLTLSQEATQLETIRINREAELATGNGWTERYAAEKVKELQEFQRIHDEAAQSAFRSTFHLKPEVVGYIKPPEGGSRNPVFQVERAWVSYEVRTDELLKAFQGGIRPIQTLGQTAIQVLHGYPFTQKSRDLNRYGLYAKEAAFQMVGICSGCGEFAHLAHLRGTEADETEQEIWPEHTSIHSHQDLARNIELIDWAASGLALDCGNIDVFGFTVSSAIVCENLQQAIKTENDRRGVVTQAEREAMFDKSQSRVRRSVLGARKRRRGM